MNLSDLTMQQRDKLGVVPDSDLAAMWKVSRSTVGKWRQHLGRPPVALVRSLPDKYLSLLGTETDEALAKEWGTSTAIVARARRARGIKPHQKDALAKPETWAQFLDIVESWTAKGLRHMTTKMGCSVCGSKKIFLLLDEEGGQLGCSDCEHRWIE